MKVLPIYCARCVTDFSRALLSQALYLYMVNLPGIPARCPRFHLLVEEIVTYDVEMQLKTQ